MALTNEDILLHRRLLASYEAQVREADRMIEAAEVGRRIALNCIAAEEAFLRDAGVDLAERDRRKGCFS